jgi:hypothetical protein
MNARISFGRKVDAATAINRITLEICARGP